MKLPIGRKPAVNRTLTAPGKKLNWACEVYEAGPPAECCLEQGAQQDVLLR